MSDTRLLSRNPFDTLIQEHQSLRDLLEEYQDLDTMQIHERALLLKKVEEEIAVHTHAQELILYPALIELNDTDISASISERMAEHRSLYSVLADLRDAHTPLLFDIAMIRLRFNTLRHLDAEEKEIYPISSQLSPITLNRLSRAMDNRENDRFGAM